MTKHHRTAGVDSGPVTINGKTYTLRPLSAGVHASMEAFIVSRRPDPLAIAGEAVKKLPASQHDAVWKAAMAQAVVNRTVTFEELAAFENSMDGLAWKIWQCANPNHPEINSLEAARALLEEVAEDNFEQILLAVEVASGAADLKKSSGQVEATETVPTGQPPISC